MSEGDHDGFPRKSFDPLAESNWIPVFAGGEEADYLIGREGAGLVYGIFNDNERPAFAGLIAEKSEIDDLKVASRRVEIFFDFELNRQFLGDGLVEEERFAGLLMGEGVRRECADQNEKNSSRHGSEAGYVSVWSGSFAFCKRR